MKIHDFISAFNTELEMNYSIHISPDYGFIYFSNPKAACTTVKGSLNLSLATALGRELIYKSLGDVHDRNWNFLRTPAEVGYEQFLDMIADPAVFKLSFIRDPLTRFCSAYANKIAYHGDIYEKFIHFLSARYGMPAGTVISAKRFAAMIAEDASLRDIDEHWRLQTRQICLDMVPEMWLGRQETVESDLRFALQRIFGQDYVFFDALTFNPENGSASADVRNLLDDTDIDNVHSAYAKDYARLPLIARLNEKSGQR
jgi:Sulfotransferase family